MNSILSESAFDLDGYLSMSELILHIPHATTPIPFLDGFVANRGVIQSQINLLTDWYADRIFSSSGATSLVVPFSRVFCDVERLNDEDEPLAKIGRGFYYTKTDEGAPLRKESAEIKKRIYRDYYLPHHIALSKLVDEKLVGVGRCTIIDCHTFTDFPLKTDLDQQFFRADICLGTNSFHTPDWLLKKFTHGFENAGYSISFNRPYSGTIVPLKFAGTEKQVNSIMVEVNRRLYLDSENQPIDEKVFKLNQVFNNIIKN